MNGLLYNCVVVKPVFVLIYLLILYIYIFTVIRFCTLYNLLFLVVINVGKIVVNIYYI